MNKLFALSVFAILFAVFISSVSQVMLKKAAMRQYSGIVQEYLNPLVIFSYILFFLTTLLVLFAYRSIPLSLGSVLETTGYVYVTFFGVFIFKEKLTKRKALALCLIILGIIIYAQG